MYTCTISTGLGTIAQVSFLFSVVLYRTATPHGDAITYIMLQLLFYRWLFIGISRQTVLRPFHCKCSVGLISLNSTSSVPDVWTLFHGYLDDEGAQVPTESASIRCNLRHCGILLLDR